jgi:signal transduction histidine kinase
MSLARHSTALGALVAIVAATTAPDAAAGWATRQQAQAMVQKAVAAIRQEGVSKIYSEITARSSRFVDGDLYVVVYGLDGMVLAHGANERLVGQDLSEAVDVDGKAFVKERMDLARKQASFWQDYKFVNPVTRKIDPKQMYCERLEETAVCAGIYRP